VRGRRPSGGSGVGERPQIEDLDARSQLWVPAVCTESRGRKARAHARRVFVDYESTGADGARRAVRLGRAPARGQGSPVPCHFRVAPEAMTVAARGAFASRGQQLHIQEGNMMLEIKPRGGFIQGQGPPGIMQERPSGRRPVFVGADLTDLDASRRRGPRPHFHASGDRVHGQFRAENPAAVRAWPSGSPPRTIRNQA